MKVFIRGEGDDVDVNPELRSRILVAEGGFQKERG